MKKFTATLFMLSKVTLISLAQSIIVHGTALNEKTLKLEDAYVSINSSDVKKTIGYDGKFRIEANIGDTLVFKSLNIRTKKVVISGEYSSVKLRDREIEYVYPTISIGYPKYPHLVNVMFVKGFITDSETGEPIQDVKISRKRLEGERTIVFNSDGERLEIESEDIEVFTDEKGYFLTSCITDHFLDFSHPDYETQHMQIEETPWDVAMERK